MKKLLVVFALVAGCGGGGGGGSDLSNFAGAWPAVNLTGTATCNGTPSTSSTTVAVTLGAGTAGADLQYTSDAGCGFKFRVSGSAATLSNGPVTCSTTSNGTTVVLTFTSYSLNTSDGHHLTLTASGSLASGGSTCSYAVTGSGTR